MARWILFVYLCKWILLSVASIIGNARLRMTGSRSPYTPPWPGAMPLRAFVPAKIQSAHDGVDRFTGFFVRRRAVWDIAAWLSSSLLSISNVLIVLALFRVASGDIRSLFSRCTFIIRLQSSHLVKLLYEERSVDIVQINLVAYQTLFSCTKFLVPTAGNQDLPNFRNRSKMLRSWHCECVLAIVIRVISLACHGGFNVWKCMISACVAIATLGLSFWEK